MHPVTVFIERFRAAVSVHIGPWCPALLELYSCKCAYCCIIGQIKWWWWWFVVNDGARFASWSASGCRGCYACLARATRLRSARCVIGVRARSTTASDRCAVTATSICPRPSTQRGRDGNEADLRWHFCCHQSRFLGSKWPQMRLRLGLRAPLGKLTALPHTT